jgi:Tfp pilus assembly protein PilF
MLIGRVFGIPEKAVDAAYAEALLKYKDIIEVDYSANYIGSDGLVSIIRDASGLYFVHYAIQPDKLSVLPHDGKFSVNFALNGMVTAPDGRLVFQYDKAFPLDFSQSQIEDVRKTGVLVEDVIPLVAGRYTFGLLLKNTLSKEFAAFEREIIIPDGVGFWMSAPLLGYQARRITAEPRQVKPFRAGDIQISCQPGQTFAAKETLTVFFQVFGMPEDLRRSGRAEFVFERNGQEFSRSEVPLRDLALTDIVREFPLQTFPPDYYKLRISLVDGQDRKAVSADSNFVVSPLAEIPRPWVAAKVMPPADHAMYAYLTGGQLVKKGDVDGGGRLLAKAYEANPQMLDYAVSFAEVLARKKEYARAKKILDPFAKTPGEKYEALALLGTWSQALGQFEEAVLYYKTYLERAGTRLDILNSIGQCYYELGNFQEARIAWEKSLEIDPKQERIGELLRQIKKRVGADF